MLALDGRNFGRQVIGGIPETLAYAGARYLTLTALTVAPPTKLGHPFYAAYAAYARNPMRRESIGFWADLSPFSLVKYLIAYSVLHHTRICTVTLTPLSRDIIIPPKSVKAILRYAVKHTETDPDCKELCSNTLQHPPYIAALRLPASCTSLTDSKRMPTIARSSSGPSVTCLIL